MTSVKAILHKEHYTTLLQSETNKIFADEPVSIGGSNKGFSPSELLASSLAACTAITLRMYADRKNMQLEKVEVSVAIESLQNQTQFFRKIELSGNLNETEKNKLLDIANRCPTHKILKSAIDIKTDLL